MGSAWGWRSLGESLEEEQGLLDMVRRGGAESPALQVGAWCRHAELPLLGRAELPQQPRTTGCWGGAGKVTISEGAQSPYLPPTMPSCCLEPPLGSEAPPCPRPLSDTPWSPEGPRQALGGSPEGPSG